MPYVSDMLAVRGAVLIPVEKELPNVKTDPERDSRAGKFALPELCKRRNILSGRTRPLEPVREARPINALQLG